MPLNLPVYEFRYRQQNGKQQVFDRLRQKFVALTPEEWVRQNMTEYLISDKGFPAARMGNEISLHQNGLIRRCDSVVYSISGEPLLIAEFKAPTVAINQTVFDQIAHYVWQLKVDFLLVSNGLNHYCCRLDYSKMEMAYLQEIPEYKNIVM